MDPLAVALLTCSLYADDALVTALADTAHGNVWMVLSSDIPLDEPDPETPPSRETSEAKIHDQLRRGEDPLIGPMHVPASWTARYARVPDDLLDPCENISIATAMLSDFDFECQPLGRPVARRGCVLTRYTQAIHLPELGRVISLVLSSTHVSNPHTHSPFEAPIFPLETEPVGHGADSIFVQTLRAPFNDDIPDPFIDSPPALGAFANTATGGLRH